MTRLRRSLLVVCLLGGAAASGGFFVFADMVGRLKPDPAIAADAIVVLTGDEERINTGMRLMESGRGHRLLISGVHPSTRIPTELKQHIKGSAALIRCCVDIGREALNTSGNADEARHWAVSRGFASLIVVTSSYHLPRSLAEFQRAMPGMRLVGYPVVSGRQLRLETWWRSRSALRLLAGEYVKFLGAVVRLGFGRLFLEAKSGIPHEAPPAHYDKSGAVTAGAAR